MLGALARLNDFLMNPLIQGHSGTTPEMSWNQLSTSQVMNEDDSQNGPHPDLGLFHTYRRPSQSPRHGDRSSEREREREREREYVSPRHARDHEEVTYCSPSTSSGKQKKNRFTSKPQFCSENTPATVEADQILLALQQLTNNNNSAIFHNNINRISKLPKSLSTTMTTFDGKSEKFELFEYFFQTSLKIHNQLTEDDKINYFHSRMKGDALQIF